MGNRHEKNIISSGGVLGEVYLAWNNQALSPDNSREIAFYRYSRQILRPHRNIFAPYICECVCVHSITSSFTHPDHAEQNKQTCESQWAWFCFCTPDYRYQSTSRWHMWRKDHREEHGPLKGRHTPVCRYLSNCWPIVRIFTLNANIMWQVEVNFNQTFAITVVVLRGCHFSLMICVSQHRSCSLTNQTYKKW